ncbi:MAG: hypothetical protein COW00_18705 [Bdellovibrio sp. CG12_big_fil_rev_8_21_14_0_65_39_13]|nr:MAG: hypothetical protein COW78_10710 [Bdellovibrio sp. CG22_combo_CG10-13_8_21_14_all_39_27]PIQ57847.1 MAG: hypothetical protein COW00_18705 [Bdellovibrio sp. CG12_big_fil_rev_8_21_14_0_65_39_13]PIR36122.1 MAG: hypothetical protein COV37_05090 [Bdellovibrio sp. CG11_big_fil_rev_8_21_14_0_20_39_38]PJB52473.1 MAG: hypothetical protein CO099_12470 [Bdellovibrio sp. CG_4_9_14_3_um_filter_39_7]
MINNAISDSLINNFLGLFTDTGEVKIEETRNFLSLSKVELASAFGLSQDQIREERMAAKTKERFAELATALEYVAETFDGDKTKTSFWLNTPNPNFGGATPKSLIIKGRYQKLLKFILAAKQGY